MQGFEAHPAMRVFGAMTVPGDKSISHRALMLSGIAEGVSEVTGFLAGEDCLATLSAMRALGVRIEQSECNACADSRRRPARTAGCGQVPRHGKRRHCHTLVHRLAVGTKI